MPIDIDPLNLNSPVTQQQPITADKLFVDLLTIDASGRDDPTKPPSATITVTPYQAGTPNLYAADSWTLKTSNLYAAIANLPKTGLAMQAVFEAVAEWRVLQVQRKSTLEAVTASHDAAAGALAAAAATLANAAKDRVAAYQAKQTATEENKAAADTAWQTADAAWTAAGVAKSSAEDAVAAATTKLNAAQAAYDDPALPEVTA